MRNFTKKEIKKLKKYWKVLDTLESDFSFEVELLENAMKKDLKIDDLEFFLNEGGCYCGIGNYSRTINLIQRDKLRGK